MNLINPRGLREKFTMLLVWISLILAVTMASSYLSVTPISENWDEYQHSTVARQKLLLKIQSAFGYGDMIHNFKNYVLRGDEKYYARIKKNSEDITKAINSYYKLPKY